MESILTMEDKIETDSLQHAAGLLEELNNLRKNGEHCDFTIRAGSKEMPVHKNVLSASSRYFKAMLAHDNVETRAGVVEVQEVDPECVVKCIDYIYTGEASVAKEKRGELMHAAHLMQLQRLCDGLALFLEDSLNAVSFFTTRNLANLYNCERLKETCNKFALKRFRDIAQLEGFMDLERDYISFLMESKETKATEAVKCKALLRWTEKDITNRGQSLSGLLTKLELLQIPSTYRSHLLRKERLFKESMECYKLIAESLIDTLNAPPRDVNVEFSEEIVTFDKTSEHLQCFNPRDRQWTQMQEIRDVIIRGNISAVYLGGYIYVFLHNLRVYRLSCADHDATWEQLANKSFRSHGTVAVLNGLIYTLETGTFSARLERYDPATNEWFRLPEKRNKIINATLAAAEGNVFCIGGASRGDVIGFSQYNRHDPSVNIVEKFDPITSTWLADENLQNARQSAASVVRSARIYVMGGIGDTTALKTAEVRCPTTKAWTLLSSEMNYGRSNFSACAIDGKIYAVGGAKWNECATIEEYDPSTERWEVVETMQNKDIEAMASISALL